MYKLLLCWRYLRTRYIALASIISVTLGVATMIVVNSVMAGFSHEMQSRINGVLSDLVLESRGLDGFGNFEGHRRKIMEAAGDDIEAMTPTVAVPAMFTFQAGGQWINRQVMFIGIDADTYGDVSVFDKYLQHPANREQLSFDLRDGGYDTVDHTLDADEAVTRHGMQRAGWVHRRMMAQREAERRSYEQVPAPEYPSEQQRSAQGEREDEAEIATESGTARSGPASDPFAAIGIPSQAASSDEGVAVDENAAQGDDFDKATEQHPGVVVGMALTSYRTSDGQDHFLALPGDDVKVTFPTAGMPPDAVSGNFTVVDFYESKMSEYDSAFVFVPLRKLQELRGMVDPVTGDGMVTSIQIKLKDGADLQAVRDKLRTAYAAHLDLFEVSSWRDKQGPLLAAVQMETSILNILLFLIIAVAGFGILAIFFMIVVEKTRDIGILKSLGASAGGVMSIFLGYGLLLGAVGAGAGMVLGLLFVAYIDEIRVLLERASGQAVFDPSIYYFQTIPTIVQPFTVGWIVGGAMLIAIAASVLPAWRAAKLHPVEALRYE